MGGLPKCHSQPNLVLGRFRPDCGFPQTAVPHPLRQSHLSWPLKCIDWDIPAAYINPLRQSYTDRLKTCEIDLGLRPPPPDAAAGSLGAVPTSCPDPRFP
ncbi:MAG: hypothetical protein IPG51_04700 [Chloroflexi bacterium]|nr:hypothetical protein [Chloroflexota bacterium]